jgi:hypothetical protein
MEKQRIVWVLKQKYFSILCNTLRRYTYTNVHICNSAVAEAAVIVGPASAFGKGWIEGIVGCIYNKTINIYFILKFWKISKS